MTFGRRAELERQLAALNAELADLQAPPYLSDPDAVAAVTNAELESAIRQAARDVTALHEAR